MEEREGRGVVWTVRGEEKRETIEDDDDWKGELWKRRWRRKVICEEEGKRKMKDEGVKLNPSRGKRCEGGITWDNL